MMRRISHLDLALLLALVMCSATGISAPRHGDGIPGLPGVTLAFDHARTATGADRRAGRYPDARARGDVAAAVRYLRRSATARGLLDRLGRADDRIVLRVNRLARDKMSVAEDGSILIEWDPVIGLMTTEGGTQSAALGLGHEIVHALHSTEDHAAFDRAIETRDDDYSEREEARTISYGETPMARELGEGVRRDHYGAEFLAGSVTGRVPVR